MLKAPKGGQTSRVNGEDYKGGRFMPETGEFCGLGKNRVPAAKLAEINATLSGCRIQFRAEFGMFQLVRLVSLADGRTAEQVQFSSANVKTLEKLVS